MPEYLNNKASIRNKEILNVAQHTDLPFQRRREVLWSARKGEKNPLWDKTSTQAMLSQARSWGPAARKAGSGISCCSVAMSHGRSGQDWDKLLKEVYAILKKFLTPRKASPRGGDPSRKPSSQRSRYRCAHAIACECLNPSILERTSKGRITLHRPCPLR